MTKISSKEIKKAILEQAKIFKRKQEIYQEVKKLNNELKTLEETFVGSFGFASPSDRATTMSKTGFVVSPNISYIAKLEDDLGPEKTEEETKPTAKK